MQVTEDPTLILETSDGAGADAALVARVLAGESGAYDELFRRHYARVYNFAVRLTGSRDSAEDIAQSAFIRTYETLSRLRDGRTLTKYLYRVVVNLVRDRAKSARRKPWIGFADLLGKGRASEQSSDEPAEFADPGMDPARIAGDRAFQKALEEQIASLPMDFREAFVLHHVEGLDIRQIAEVVGAPEGTVKSRIGRARKRLAEAVGPWME
jgi:RNA polymerase sigma-70 factor (ECF subfamily)